MSRLSETIDLIDTMNKGAEVLKPDSVIAGLLADIAKSLAVIADKMGEQEHEQLLYSDYGVNRSRKADNV